MLGGQPDVQCPYTKLASLSNQQPMTLMPSYVTRYLKVGIIGDLLI